MKIKLVFTFCAGIAAGLIAMALVGKFNPSPADNLPEPVVAPPPPAANVAHLQQKIQRLETVNAELAGQLASRPARPAATVVTGEAMALPVGEVAIDSTEMIAGFEKQRRESTLAVLKLRLKLTDAQVAGLTALMEKQAAARHKLMAGGGEFSIGIADEEAELRNELPSVLTPDQVAGYDQFQKDQRQAQVQQMANAELAQMQPMLQLTPEQQDKVFAILAKEAERFVGQSATPAALDAAGFVKAQEAKTAALREVLTPEQYDVYQKNLASPQVTIIGGGHGVSVMGAGGGVGMIQIMATPVEAGTVETPPAKP